MKVEHLKWLVSHANSLKTACGKDVGVYDFVPDFSDTKTFSEWAKHFRNHYCADSDIDNLRGGTRLTRAKYLEDIKFPSTAGLGPGIRSGDFAEILIADFLEYILDHWVPRTRYSDRTIRDESTKGTDVIGFKMINDTRSSLRDTLSLFEVKAQFSGNAAKPRLQNAIDDSGNDSLRKSESLNAIKQRLLAKGEKSSATKVERFQAKLDDPYVEKFGAVAVYDQNLLAPTIITEATTSGHPAARRISLFLVSINDAMRLVHYLYKIAADEA